MTRLGQTVGGLLRFGGLLRTTGPVVLLIGLFGCVREDRGLRCPPGSLLVACRQRCISDGDCLAPARCDHLTSTCQQPAVACDPLQTPTEASSDGGMIPIGPCSMGQECDLITRTCIPLSGSPCGQDSDCRIGELCAGGVCHPAIESRRCQRDADCAAPSVCRLTVAGGTLVSVCAPPLGPSEGGARCRQNTECQSGLCLRSGICFAGCTSSSVKADCHGRDGVICGRVPLPLPSGSGSSGTDWVQSCTLAPTDCQSDRDCEAAGATCQPIADPEQTSALRTVCLLARGDVRPGSPCTKDSDCSSGLCQGTFCFAACRTAADCRSGFACRPASYQVEGRSGRLQSCVPSRTCTSRSSCPASDETCTPQPTAADDALELVCTPGRGRLPGQACRSGSECASGLCSDQGLCVGGCGVDADCPKGPSGESELCRPLVTRVRGISGSVKSCLVPRLGCRRDSDCSAMDTLCNPYSSLDDSTRIALGCGPAAFPGKRPAGTACILNSDCKSGLCLMNTQPPVCYGTCSQDADCLGGRRCYADSTWFLTSGSPGQPSATYDATSSCWPDIGSRRACIGDGSTSDCPAGETCVLLPDARQTSFVKRCQRPVGSKQAGTLCVEDRDCQSNRCSQALATSGSRCIAPCSPGGTNLCSAGTSCKTGTLEIRPGKTSALTICLP